LTSRTKLIAGAVTVAVLAAGGAAFAAVELTSSSHSATEPAVTAPFGDGVGSYGLGGGRLGGRGLGGGLGPVGERDDFGAGRFGLRRGFLGGGLGAAATYLGLSTVSLRTQLDNGQTCAQIAKAQGKTVDGLVAAMVAARKRLLDTAVSNGVLTQAQATALESRLTVRIEAMVNGVHRFRGPGGPGSFGSPA
jgi:hypothetical protein